MNEEIVCAYDKGYNKGVEEFRKEVDKITEELYNFNANISLYIAIGKRQSMENSLNQVNQKLGEIIKKLRDL